LITSSAQLHDENGEDDAPGPVASKPGSKDGCERSWDMESQISGFFRWSTYGYDWNTATKKLPPSVSPTPWLALSDPVKGRSQLGASTQP
jgi:hypothetical protein